MCKNNKEYQSWFTRIEEAIQRYKGSPRETSMPWINHTLESSNPERSESFSSVEHNSFAENVFDNEDEPVSSFTTAELEWIDCSLEKHLSKHPECASTIVSDHVEMILK